MPFNFSQQPPQQLSTQRWADSTLFDSSPPCAPQSLHRPLLIAQGSSTPSRSPFQLGSSVPWPSYRPSQQPLPQFNIPVSPPFSPHKTLVVTIAGGKIIRLLESESNQIKLEDHFRSLNHVNDYLQRVQAIWDDEDKEHWRPDLVRMEIQGHKIAMKYWPDVIRPWKGKAKTRYWFSKTLMDELKLHPSIAFLVNDYQLSSVKDLERAIGRRRKEPGTRRSHKRYWHLFVLLTHRSLGLGQVGSGNGETAS
ncbi:hypothetical protein HHX47_DHR2000137 [Lentinula edodes]|nr:hypothetical protein HHX47_DHR2000137 [Lentinula edodes]